MKIIVKSEKYGVKKIIIDKKDYKKINGLTIGINFSHSNFYAVVNLKIKGVRKTKLLHRFLLNPPKNKIVDHINGNGLDNRRSNLRLCTNTQNCKNKKLSKLNTSGFKGVDYHKKTKKFRARICVNMKLIHLGLFLSALDAYKAYCKASKKYHGIWGNIKTT